MIKAELTSISTRSEYSIPLLYYYYYYQYHIAMIMIYIEKKPQLTIYNFCQQ